MSRTTQIPNRKKLDTMFGSNLIVCDDFESSNIESIAYSEKNKLLYIEFKNGSIYEYSKVPMDEFILLTKASSKGKHYAAFIRDEFDSERIK